MSDANATTQMSPLGARSTAAAILFTVLYFPFLPLFIWYRVRQASSVYTIAIVFSAVRITAFAIRAAITQSASAASDRGLLIGDAILFGVGFSGLLLSSYQLVIDREKITGIPLSGLFARLLQNRHFIHLCLLVPVILGIVGVDTLIGAKSQSSIDTGNALRDASTYIFLAITIFLAVQALLVAHREIFASTGSIHTAVLLLLLIVFLLIHQCFLTVATVHREDANNEKYWYPLVALPELLALAVLAAPGLVPPPELLNRQPTRSEERGQGYAHPSATEMV